jgi:Mg-chelatase subunit ChlD
MLYATTLLLFLFGRVLAGEAELVELIQKYESVVKSYAEVLKSEQKSLELNCDTTCLAKVSYACGGFINSQDVTLSTDFGTPDGCPSCSNADRKLNTKASTFLTVKQLSKSVDASVGGDTCLAHQALESKFVSDGQADILVNSPRKWRYVGLPSGVFFQYPGILQQKCEGYDPRLRPWYIAATSGPKDVLFILDISGSMKENGRLNLLKDAMNSVLTTLTANDYFNIITFSTGVQYIDSTIPYMIPATKANIGKMKELINRLEATGDTNMVGAFEQAILAFSNKNPASETSSSSNCRKAALFLTDGKPTLNQTPQSVKTAAAKLSSSGVKLFTYSLGDGADHNTAKDIACSTGGLWSAVEDGGNLRTQMSNYYQFFEVQRTTGSSNVIWSEYCSFNADHIKMLMAWVLSLLLLSQFTTIVEILLC